MKTLETVRPFLAFVVTFNRSARSYDVNVYHPEFIAPRKNTFYVNNESAGIDRAVAMLDGNTFGPTNANARAELRRAMIEEKSYCAA